MVTVIEFVVQLVDSVVELAVTAPRIALADPLAFVSFLMGALLILFSMAVMGYLTLGAVGSLVGLVTSTPNRPPDAPGRGGAGGGH